VLHLDPANIGDVALSHAALLLGGPFVLSGSHQAHDSSTLGHVHSAFAAIEDVSRTGTFANSGCHFRTSLDTTAFPNATAILKAMAMTRSGSGTNLPSVGWDAMWSCCDKPGERAASLLVNEPPACVPPTSASTQLSVHFVGRPRRHKIDPVFKYDQYVFNKGSEEMRWVELVAGVANVTLSPAPCTTSDGATCSPVTTILRRGDVVVYRRAMWAASAEAMSDGIVLVRHTKRYTIPAVIAAFRD